MTDGHEAHHENSDEWSGCKQAGIRPFEDLMVEESLVEFSVDELE